MKDYEDGNATHAWKKLMKKFDPVSAPTLVKTERIHICFSYAW
jgi:hypothetical protein